MRLEPLLSGSIPDVVSAKRPRNNTGFSGSLCELTNCRFVANHAVARGGAIYVRGAGSCPTIASCASYSNSQPTCKSIYDCDMRSRRAHPSQPDLEPS